MTIKVIDGCDLTIQLIYFINRIYLLILLINVDLLLVDICVIVINPFSSYSHLLKYWFLAYQMMEWGLAIVSQDCSVETCGQRRSCRRSQTPSHSQHFSPPTTHPSSISKGSWPTTTVNRWLRFDFGGFGRYYNSY